MYYVAENGKKLLGLTEDGLAKVDDYVYIKIGDYIESIDEEAFRYVFEYNEDKKYFWNLRLNNGLKEISDYAFDSCDGLIGELVLPNSITKIGYSAFAGCCYLGSNLTLPNYLEEIGDFAFYGCYLLGSKNLIIPSTVKKIGGYAFNKTQIQKITFGTKWGTPIPEITSPIFFDMKNLTEIDITNWKYEDFLNAPFGDLKIFNGLEAENGKILVHDENSLHLREEWEHLIRINHALKESWTIEFV